MFRDVIIAAALSFGCAPVFAQSVNESDATRRAEAGVEEVIRETQLYTALTTEATDLILEVMDRANETATMAEEGASEDEIRAWADAWIPATRLKFAAIKSRLKAASPVSTAHLLAMAPADPQVLKMARHVEAYPKTTLATIDNITKLFEKIAKGAPAAASGNEKATVRLAASVLDGTRALIALENNQVQQAIDSLPPGHPNAWLGRSAIALNEGMIEVLTLVSAELSGDATDAIAASVRILHSADQARSHARRAGPAARKGMEQSRADETIKDSALLARLEKAFVSYDDSIKIELVMADHLESVAQIVAQEGVLNDDADMHLNALSELADERARLDEMRRAALAK